jgi:hypothetical protein
MVKVALWGRYPKTEIIGPHKAVKRSLYGHTVTIWGIKATKFTAQLPLGVDF